MPEWLALPTVDCDTPSVFWPDQTPAPDLPTPSAARAFGLLAAASPAATLPDDLARSAVYLAAAEIGGGKENPPGSNHTTYWAEVYPAANGPGMDWAWCAGFLCAVYNRLGIDWRGIVAAPFYCPSIESWARVRGFWTTTPWPGDLVLYGYTGPGQVSPHIGIFERWTAGAVQAIEGNTSPGSAGSQDNGGGVYRRVRSLGWVRGFVDMRAAITYYTARGVWEPVDPRARQTELAAAGFDIEIDGIYGPATRADWSEYMTITDRLDALEQTLDKQHAETLAVLKSIRDKQRAEGWSAERIPMPSGEKVSAATAMQVIARNTAPKSEETPA